jgi:hypothetical protein
MTKAAEGQRFPAVDPDSEMHVASWQHGAAVADSSQ